jgi:neutral trehalase
MLPVALVALRTACAVISSPFTGWRHHQLFTGFTSFDAVGLSGGSLPEKRTFTSLPSLQRARPSFVAMAVSTIRTRLSGKRACNGVHQWTAGDDVFADRAEARRNAMHTHMWDEALGHFCDFDLAANARRPQPTAAALAPLLSGVATQAQADASAAFAVERLRAPGGLRTTLVTSGQQWDEPNGWAPLQWIAAAGLRRYGHDALAQDIARRWIATVEAAYARTGLVFEKYDVEAGAVGAGGEYAPQIGFGWTNGVTADLIDSLNDGRG